MSNDIRSLINQEIKDIDQMLTVHSYHRQALKELLDKMGEVQQPVQEAKKDAWKKQCREFGRKVAQLVRERDCSKTDAVRTLLESGEIDTPLKTAQAMVAPSNLGTRFHNKLFEGTRYGKQS